MWRADSLEKTLMLGGIGGRRRRGQQRMRGWMASLTRWTWVSVNSGSWWWIGRPGVLQFMGSQRVGHDWATDLIWSDLILTKFKISSLERTPLMSQITLLQMSGFSSWTPCPRQWPLYHITSWFFFPPKGNVCQVPLKTIPLRFLRQTKTVVVVFKKKLKKKKY